MIIIKVWSSQGFLLYWQGHQVVPGNGKQCFRCQAGRWEPHSRCWSHWLGDLGGSGLTALPGGFHQPWPCLVWGHITTLCVHPEFWSTREYFYSVAGKGHLGTWQVWMHILHIWFPEWCFCLGMICTRTLTINSLSSQIQTLSCSDWSCLVLASGLLIAFIKKWFELENSSPYLSSEKKLYAYALWIFKLQSLNMYLKYIQNCLLEQRGNKRPLKKSRKLAYITPK